jgi:hypothetical protein
MVRMVRSVRARSQEEKEAPRRLRDPALGVIAAPIDEAPLATFNCRRSVRPTLMKKDNKLSKRVSRAQSTARAAHKQLGGHQVR